MMADHSSVTEAVSSNSEEKKGTKERDLLGGRKWQQFMQAPEL